jgi:hypothetical protein
VAPVVPPTALHGTDAHRCFCVFACFEGATRVGRVRASCCTLYSYSTPPTSIRIDRDPRPRGRSRAQPSPNFPPRDDNRRAQSQGVGGCIGGARHKSENWLSHYPRTTEPGRLTRASGGPLAAHWCHHWCPGPRPGRERGRRRQRCSLHAHVAVGGGAQARSRRWGGVLCAPRRRIHLSRHPSSLSPSASRPG